MSQHSRSSAHPRRVVVTGMGAVTNLGLDAPTTWDAMLSGRSGISLIKGEEFDRWSDQWSVKIGGQIHDFDPAMRIDKREARRLDRFAQLGVTAAIEAVSHSGIDFSKEDPTRCGAVIGSGVGGISTIEAGVETLLDKGPDRLSPFTVTRLMINAVAGDVSIRFNLQGPTSAHATACASSGNAIADAIGVIRRGEADVMLAGGAEGAVTPICLAAFMTMRALSQRNDDPTRASRPFDRERDGFVLSEGAGVFVLEEEEHARKRGATIYAELAGFGMSTDAYHITAPDEKGRGASRSMTWAMQDAGLNPSEVDYINSHGTSTPLGDAAEVAAVTTVFGDHALASKGGKLLMSSTKSMHGHTLGASGAVEMLACINALRHGVAPPTINLENPSDGFDIDFCANKPRERKLRVALNNTFGFGGHNVTLVLKAYA
ncbi:MAG: beta-ketoacyl-ACP synthase II [Phycisphaeraceae bacterium]|nr:beta-ketoacyl-ACP synthase II [Phycisphaeraceae bacterium]